MNGKKKGIIKSISENPTIAAVIGAIAGAVAAALLTIIAKDVQYHDAVTYNNISSYIKSELVRPGLVGDEILEKEDPFQQIEMIGNVLSEKDFQNEEIRDVIENFLVSCGENEFDVNDVSELKNSFFTIGEKIISLEGDNSDLSAQLDKLSSKILAELDTPKAYISGEALDTTMKNYLAIINSHKYYSEEFLNSFLPSQLSYEEDTIYYDKTAPERVNAINSELIYDIDSFYVYNGNDHFTMGLQDYNNGIRPDTRSSSHLVNIACNKNYSQMEFTLGHVDNTSREEGTLTIYYMDNKGEFKEAQTFSLYANMPIETYSVPIYNTRTVHIVLSNGIFGDYALADIYLVK